MHYEQRGAGPALLLIPGLGLEVAELTRLLDALGARCSVTAIDNRGAGRSSQPPGPYSIAQMADDAAGLVRRLGLEGATVLGISMGAKVALDLAIRHRALVGRLVLVGAQFRARRRTPLAVRVGRASRVLGVGRGRTPQSVAAFDAQARASAAYDCEGRLGEVRCPTLVLAGDRDRLAPLAQARELAERVPDGRLVTFRGGHLAVLFGARELVAREASAFAAG